MVEPRVPVSSRRTLLACACACASAAGAAALAGCARGSSSSGGMAASQPAQGNSAAVPADWASRAAAGVDQAILGQPASGQPASPQPASPQPASGQPPSLALTSDVPVGGGKILADKKIVITQPRAGSFEAFAAVCTHQGCTVSSVSGGTINCPCHGSKFKIADGSVANGPASQALAKKNVTVANGKITLA